MAEKEQIFSSKISNTGFFSFSSFYQFCYDWLTEETNLLVSESKYKESLRGDSKNLEIEWTGTRKVTDYFKFEVKVKFLVTGLKEVEIEKEGTKIKTNSGRVELEVKGILVRDYQGKFERTAFQKFLRSIYEKWVIASRIDEYEGRLIGNCDEFLNQAKAYLDLAGKK